MPLGPSYGFDITLIDETTVAITDGKSGQNFGIDIIDIKNQRKIKFIKLPGRTWGITRDHNSLFVCVEGEFKKDRNSNMIYIAEVKTRLGKEIRQKRAEINKRLDNLEKQLIKDLEEKECQSKDVFKMSYHLSQKMKPW
ncbi:Hypothetical predicted protein [Mytilus galloprovincialis]|uniref:Uncharacterized protein n=1 Tax=Mytilus galloprovincialis TaxID=29158 RepID=A0A8B6DY05_MYTGA|nr:Hypothetical predicted protein [Mytilus galloprovincialis]